MTLGLVLCVVLAGSVGLVTAADGATLRGTLTYDGPPPSTKPLVVDHDMDCCAKKPIAPESLLVSDENKVLNAVVWLEGVEGDKPWPTEGAVMDQVGCIFVPHVTVIGVGQTMRYLNSDPIIHNIHTWPRTNSPMSVSQLAKGLGRPIKRKFAEPDEVKITCDVHKWMGAWIIVRDNPYYSQTAEDGVFEITDIPPGTYKMVVWHESLRRVEKQVELSAGASHAEEFQLELK
jgi:plastocyanin